MGGPNDNGDNDNNVIIKRKKLVSMACLLGLYVIVTHVLYIVW